MMLIECDTCLVELPESKFNLESASPESCFRCRVQGARFGFSGGRESFHGNSLVGGTIASDNRHTVAEARSKGHDPVPVKNGEGAFTPTVGQTERLKQTLLAKPTKLAL